MILKARGWLRPKTSRSTPWWKARPVAIGHVESGEHDII